MKLCLTMMVAALALVSFGVAGQADPAADTAHYGIMAPPPGANVMAKASNADIWRIRVLSLRREALELQKRDGGQLTSEHHEMLQAKLDRINAEARMH